MCFKPWLDSHQTLRTKQTKAVGFIFFCSSAKTRTSRKLSSKEQCNIHHSNCIALLSTYIDRRPANRNTVKDKIELFSLHLWGRYSAGSDITFSKLVLYFMALQDTLVSIKVLLLLNATKNNFKWKPIAIYFHKCYLYYLRI